MKKLLLPLFSLKLDRILTTIIFVISTGLPMISQAAFDPVNDDTDIFLANPNIPANRPNVLIILDNTANWSRNVGGQAIFVNEQSALVNVVSNLGEEFNIGLMMYPETGGGNDSVDGGYLRFGIRQMTPTNRTVLANMVGGFGQNADKGNNNTIALSMMEAFRYYSGGVNIASHGKVKSDFDGNTNNPAFSNGLGDYPLGTTPTATSTYVSPIQDSCQDSFIIIISNGPANENSNALSDSEDELDDIGYDVSSDIALSPSGQEGNWADEWADYMANADMNGADDGTPHVYTYVVEVDPETQGQADDHTALMQSVANKGKGAYFAVSSTNAGQGIVNALNQIFQEIQAVNSVFASSTLPVSVNVRGTNLNQVYIGVFRPDEEKSPRWFGNLKAYQLGFNSSTSTLFLADSTGSVAENPTSGFINANATSFWSTVSSFWGFRDAEENGPGGDSDAPDGDLVEKGGVAQQIREAYPTDQSTRNLFTCTSGGSDPCVGGDSLSDTPFSTSNDALTTANLGLGTISVASLSALDTQTVTTLTDTRTVTSATTAAGSPISITNLDNGATSFSIGSMTTGAGIALDGLTNSPTSQSISSLNEGSGGNKNIITAVVNGHGYSNNQSVTISGVSSNDYNGTFNITVVNANTFTYDSGVNNPSNNPNIASAVASTTSSIATATVNGHGFSSGNSVTISGVTPNGFNSSYASINVVDANTFTFSTGTPLAPVTSIAGATVRNNSSSIATATTSVAHGFTPGQSITISGATPAGYNNSFTTITASGTTFTFNAGSALGTATTPGAVIGTSTTVTATSTGHGLAIPGPTQVTISGAVPNEYNGTFDVTGVDANTFTYTSLIAVGAWDNTSSPTFNAGTSTQVLATIAGHGFGIAGDTVTIDVEGANDDLNTPSINYNGDNISATVVDANTVTYVTVNGDAPGPASGTITAHLSTATAIATVPNHGLSDSDSVTIAGAVDGVGADDDDYNGTFTVDVINVNTFQYPLAVITPQLAASGTITASVETTTAHANVVNHGLSDGDSVTVSGATPAQFNGTFTATVAPSDTDNFTYTITPAAGDATGTIVIGVGVAAGVATDLINWVRGADNEEDEDTDTSFTDIRPSIHGDVLHSRPAVVNYNRFGNDDDVYIFYGANDGVFRAAKGGFNQADVSEILPGHEEWGFIPEEHFDDLQRLRNNSPKISSSNKKPYFADGSIGVFVNDEDDDGIIDTVNSDADDKVYIYISNHRGGRFIYALDVSDPDDPKFLWKKTSTDWPELGQTWSVPFVTQINATSNPVLVFGAGYDPLVEDVDPGTITAFNVDDDTDGNLEIEVGAATFERSMGRGIFVVDATDGSIIFQAGPAVADTSDPEFLVVPGMNCAIPGDGAVITHNGGSIDNRAYFGDTCANIWRLDMEDADPANWTVIKLADLNDESTIPGGLRKFLFPPDVVYDDTFDAVLIGSGDREHPFDDDVVNRFYMVRDEGTSTSAVTTNITESVLFDATSNCIQDSTACSGNGDEIDPDTANAALISASGWYITLNTGEKVTGNSVTLNNITFFNTNQPSTGVSSGLCTSDLGIARQYAVNFDDATAFVDKNVDGSLTSADRSEIHPGGGYLPSPVPVVVEIDGKVHEGVISGVRVDDPPGASLGARLRKFWYKEFE